MIVAKSVLIQMAKGVLSCEEKYVKYVNVSIKQMNQVHVSVRRARIIMRHNGKYVLNTLKEMETHQLSKSVWQPILQSRL